jgi:NAD-dependent dihydropyrimidine dehydrogenase PreA subunit
VRVRDIALEILQTAFRLFPWPTQTGLRPVGEPGPFSPVIVTGNYDLTVRRVLRALRGVDAWLVVAPSGGINVWCAAAGGHLSTHQVVTALKTSGVEQRVRHRRAILPQLAATGVQAREVSRRCKWRVRFGPVYAVDIPAYLDGGERKSDDMRHVRFALVERLEMAASWAAPTAIVAGIAGALLRPGFAAPLVALSLLLALALFLVYDRLPEPRRLVFGAVALGVSLAVVALAGGGPAALATGALAVALLVAVLTFDYPGTTPLESGSFFEQRSWRITLDLDRCRGVYSCWEVCPEACSEKREGVRQIDLAHDARCVRCGACVVQCPMDALYFEDEGGRRVEPETIRRYKLNMMGRRAVEADAAPPSA